MDDPEVEDGFGMSVPFVIDGEGYTDRDRAMFVAGYEFCLVRVHLETNPDEHLSRPVHNENLDRLMVLCNRFARRCTFERIDGTWSHMEILPVE